MCSHLEYLNILDRKKKHFFPNKELVLTREDSSYLIESRRTHFSSQLRKQIRAKPWVREDRVALRMSSKSLAAGILESILKGNKLLIKTQYLQWPLSNSRCRQGDFSTNNKEGPAPRSDSRSRLAGARITWDTEKRLSRNEATQKESRPLTKQQEI